MNVNWKSYHDCEHENSGNEHWGGNIDPDFDHFGPDFDHFGKNVAPDFDHFDENFDSFHPFENLLRPDFLVTLLRSTHYYYHFQNPYQCTYRRCSDFEKLERFDDWVMTVEGNAGFGYDFDHFGYDFDHFESPFAP